MKAKKVKGLKPSLPLGDAAERILLTRLAEVEQLAPDALAGRDDDAHDLRIAVKRLRYVLDSTVPVLGPYAETARKRCKRLQDVLGDLHDHEVLAARATQLRDELHADDVARLVARPKDPRAARHRTVYRGLELVAAHAEAQRALGLRRFRRAWHALEREDFAGQLRAAARGGEA